MAETKTIVQKRTHIANYILVIAAIVLLLAYPCGICFGAAY
ncbi:MAG: hypothetical protein ACLVFT_03805 [Megasphaera lornae]